MNLRATAGKYLVNIARMVLGATFVFSGYVKAIDPLGSQYKIHDYLDAMGLATMVPDTLLLGVAVLLSTLEFAMGVFLLLAIHRHTVSKLAALFMTLMTLTTVWVYVADPVQDCGCFGDALVLTNGETLLKNIVLLACAILVAWQPGKIIRFLSLESQWMAFHYTLAFTILTSVWCLYDLPLKDFRPYHIGANIAEGMTIPEDAEQPEFETTFIMEKDGERKEFALEDYPDSTWTFIDSRTTVLKPGYQPPIHDFTIVDGEGNDLTDGILADEGYTMLLISPHLETADDTNFGAIDQMCEYAEDNNCRFICLTASGEEGIRQWANTTGAEYQFCNADETTLKTIIRSNPGIVLLKGGTVINKWSHNSLPDLTETSNIPIEKQEWAQLAEDDSWWVFTKVVLMFFIPLILLTIADRLWAWSRWIKDIERLRN